MLRKEDEIEETDLKNRIQEREVITFVEVRKVPTGVEGSAVRPIILVDDLHLQVDTTATVESDIDIEYDVFVINAVARKDRVGDGGIFHLIRREMQQGAYQGFQSLCILLEKLFEEVIIRQADSNGTGGVFVDFVSGDDRTGGVWKAVASGNGRF